MKDKEDKIEEIDVTHWTKALEWLNKIGLVLESEPNMITFTRVEPSGWYSQYQVSMPIEKYMDMFIKNRDAFENIAFLAKSKIS